MFQILLIALAVGFAVLFGVLVIPPFLQSGDVFGAIAAGFVNPYAAGYASDAIFCWCILAVWIIHEARTLGVRYGWVALLLGVVPGVATGLAVYLLMRRPQVVTTGLKKKADISASK